MSAAEPRIKRPPLIWFPLLAKELTEKANRPRTYWIRTAYALAFFCYFGFEGYALLENATGLGGLGTGAVFFERIYRFQLIGTILFLPALMSGLITYEKERASLPLLLTTDLAPWRIVLQKYIGGLMPMLALQLTAIPMTAVAYSLGGVEARDVFYLACSAYCGTSVGAFVCAYLLGAVWFALLVPLTSIEVVLGFPLPPNVEIYELQFLLLKLLPALALGLLGLATYWLRSRAEVSRKNRLRAVFRVLDKGFKRINDLAGGVNFSTKSHSLPEAQPVRWRELHQRSLAQPHYLVRMGLIVEIVAVAVLLYVASKASPWGGSESEELSLLFYTLWALYALVLIVQGANIVASERSQQTLDVLLTTPLKGSTILREKSVVFVRIATMAIIPLGTVCWVETSMEHMPLMDAFKYGIYSLVTFIVGSCFVFWLAVATGLRMRSSFKALLTAIVILIVMSALPKVTGYNPIAILLSPTTAITLNETNWINNNQKLFNQPFFIHLNLAIIALAAFTLRFDCLARADRWLGRAN
jgi:ABC-type transport system involved in multi-copper enzyme maturation permease subunit